MSSKLLQLQGTFVSKELERKEGMLKKTLKWRSKYKPDEIRWVSFFFLSYIALMDVTMQHTIRLMSPRSFLACFKKHSVHCDI